MSGPWLRPRPHRPSRLFRVLQIGAMLLAMTHSAAAEPAGADLWDAYEVLLQQHTRATDDLAQTRVDYAALRKDAAWKALVAALGRTDPKALQGRDATLAYWINVYNILAIDVVVKGDPKESIRDLGGVIFNQVWDQPAGTIAGASYTLGQVEHEILRPLGDPRIHGAIVCASYSCPPLARTPYRAASLDADLTANLERWLAHPEKGVRVDRANETLYLTSILDWFEEDFGGEQGAIAFAATYAREDDRSWIRANAKAVDVEYLDYDWSLNRL